MKKTLFVKFLFLLLCGSVLTTAGCKDYDDDIDALRNDVEDLKGAVVELNGFENRIAALEQVIPRFKNKRDVSLVEGMKVLMPIYKVIGKIPAVRNFSNKICVMKK